MFERFTEGSIKAIVLAQDDARSCRNNFVGTEHLLLGLLGEGSGIAYASLTSVGVDLIKVRLKIEKLGKPRDEFLAVDVPFDRDAKSALEQSWASARSAGVNRIDTQHLLLALIGDHTFVAAKILEALDVNILSLAGVVRKRMPEAREIALHPDSVYGDVTPGVLLEAPINSLTKSQPSPSSAELSASSQTLTSTNRTVIFEEFTKEAIGIMQLARNEARRLIQ